MMKSLKSALLLLQSFLFLFICHVVADNAQVYKVQPCNADTYYPVIVNNVTAEERNGHIFVSGSLSTDDELISPISASLSVKRYLKWMNSWLPVACIDGIGSCTYNDLCSYGISQNKSCPNNFVKNNVPCRCPIMWGTYTIEPNEKMYLFTLPKKVYFIGSKIRSPVAGTYWIQVQIMSGKNLLSCYQLYVDYDDEIVDLELNEV